MESRYAKSLCKRCESGALVNRAVSEADTGSPTRGGRPATHAVKQDDGYLLNGVKTFTSMSKALTHYIVIAYVADLQEVGFFLVPREEFDGVEIAENWNMVGRVETTESHDLVLNDVWVPKRLFVESKESHNRMAGYCIFKYIFRNCTVAKLCYRHHKLWSE